MLKFENQNIEFKQVYVLDIREMLLQNSGRSFEKSRSMDQELTFHTLETEMQKRSIEIGPSQMRTLKLIGDDGLYTNLGFVAVGSV